MQCDICHTREATVHLTEIINNKVTKLHLCEQCAREKSQEMEEHFGLADLLSGLADLVPVVEKDEKITAETGIKCACGFTFNSFRKMGRLGCPKCYETFKEQLSPLLRKIHGSDRHTGKLPMKKEAIRGKGALLSDLKTKLEKAIKLEEFEEAARLRDQLKALERKKKK
ncbi:MAG: UvrB/UvrC motif-containing protein [Candidatus Omnitrophota bacterium]|nr:MAG: UvrB/UvrC motif-containing protein [Candidatus Omnitrophota bacterium]